MTFCESPNTLTVYSEKHRLRDAKTELQGGTLEDDLISFFKLKSDDFTDYGTRIGAVMTAVDVPALFVLEGGYAVSKIEVNVVNVLTGFESAQEVGQRPHCFFSERS